MTLSSRVYVQPLRGASARLASMLSRKVPLLSRGKAEQGPPRYPSPLRSLHDLTGMRGSGSLPKRGSIVLCDTDEKEAQIHRVCVRL